MARLQIPNYSPTARGSYVCTSDSSIDRDLFERECAELEAGGKNPIEVHPLHRYWCGEGRYDLDTVMDFDGRQVRPRDYLTAGDPEVFSLRRLSWEEWNEVERTADSRTKYLRCCRLGVVGAEGSPLKLTVSGGALTSDSMQALHDADLQLPVALGVAVYLYNLPATSAEKKR